MQFIQRLVDLLGKRELDRNAVSIHEFRCKFAWNGKKPFPNDGVLTLDRFADGLDLNELALRGLKLLLAQKSEVDLLDPCRLGMGPVERDRNLLDRSLKHSRRRLGCSRRARLVTVTCGFDSRSNAAPVDLRPRCKSRIARSDIDKT